MFLRYGPNNTKILYIPSIFISYNGEALDEKTVLLRSVEGINRESVRMLHLLGHNDVTRVTATLGTEQEFFLVDRALYALRPDLRMAGRALVGSLPPKHQQMEDHYFGRIPSRALAVMNEAELECYKLGVPIKTRHNEVAPAQFEMAPIFEDATVAVDHNLLTMDVLHQVAHKHKMKVITRSSICEVCSTLYTGTVPREAIQGRQWIWKALQLGSLDRYWDQPAQPL